MSTRLSFRVFVFSLIFVFLFVSSTLVFAEDAESNVDEIPSADSFGSPAAATSPSAAAAAKSKSGGIPFISAFIASISMILVSEFGDKTFFIAAIMSMKNSRVEVFLSAMSALALMTVLSAAMGFTLPNILPPRLTHAAATVLFLFFGIKLLYDAWGMDGGVEGKKEEMNEVEEEIEHASLIADPNSQQANSLEMGVLATSTTPSTASINSKTRTIAKRVWFFLRRFFSPVFISCFTMTFLAEWGDRSQIATIALAAAKDPYGVTIGGIVGHSICTGVAVLGGKLLATKVSERTISIVGGVLFLLFAVHSVVYGENEFM